MGETFVLQAQKKMTTEIQYTTELQSDFGKQVNWVNLLSLRGVVPTESLGLWDNGQFEAQSISIYKTSRQRIAADLQIFSNIEEDNLPIGPFILGYTQYIGKAVLFGGLRNVNEDYFTTSYASLFTNSSCGIYPTLSANFTLANYPMSAICLHMEYNLNNRMQIKNSLYNGKAYLPFKQESSVFTVAPRRDGILDIAQLSYTSSTRYYGNYVLGTVVHSGGRFSDDSAPEKTTRAEALEQYASSQKMRVNYAVWLSAEQAIFQQDNRSVGLFGQLSFAPADRNDCHRYVAAGCIFKGFISSSKQDLIGLVISHAAFEEAKETTMEITWNYPVADYLEIQPAFHFIKTGNDLYNIGMLRLIYTY